MISQKSDRCEWRYLFDGRSPNEHKVADRVTGFDRALSKCDAALTLCVGVLLELWLVTEGLYLMKYFSTFSVFIFDSIAGKIRSTYHAGGARDGNCW